MKKRHQPLPNREILRLARAPSLQNKLGNNRREDECKRKNERNEWEKTR